jgi:hypothetical protein
MSGSSRRNVSAYMLCYALFGVVFALSVMIVFIWRVALVELITVVNGRSYANRSLYMLGMVGIGLTLFGVVVAAEAYLRFGVERRQLLRRFARVALPLAVVAAAGLALQLMLAG